MHASVLFFSASARSLPVNAIAQYGSDLIVRRIASNAVMQHSCDAIVVRRITWQRSCDAIVLRRMSCNAVAQYSWEPFLSGDSLATRCTPRLRFRHSQANFLRHSTSFLLAGAAVGGRIARSTVAMQSASSESHATQSRCYRRKSNRMCIVAVQIARNTVTTQLAPSRLHVTQL